MRSAGGTVAALVFSLALLPACQQPQVRLADRVTFTEHVAPIVFDKCATCHRPGEAAPFSLLTYRDVESHAQQIAQVTRDRFMPPWLPESGDVPFVGDRSLTEQQIELFRRWVKQGAVEGDPARLPPLPEWTAGWLLGPPDLIVSMPQAYTLGAEGFDVFRNFVIPIPVERTHWVRAVELRPGNKRIVHHAIMHIDNTSSSRELDTRDEELGFGGMEMGNSVPPDGHFLGWTPGKLPLAGSDDLAWKLERGTDMVLQLHMLPTGRPEQIRPQIGFHFADGPPKMRPFIIVLENSEIDIPPGEKDYVLIDEMLLPVPIRVTGLYPHAHYLGKVLDVHATLPDGTRKTLIHIGDWDFNWQDEYRFERPVLLPAGARLTMHYTYDNSAANPRNPTIPPVRVVWGNRSTDEMGNLALQVLLDSDEDHLTLEETQSRHRIARDPDDFAGHNNLGNTLFAMGRTDEAIEHLQRATNARPDRYEVHYNLGAALATRGDHDRAIAQYREALRINPSFAPAHNNWGNSLLAQERIDEALVQLHRALELRPDFDEAHYNLGNALLTAGRPAEAATRYEQALAISPDYAMTYNNLGVALQSQGKIDQAVAAFRQALEVDPDLVEARRNLDLVLTSLSPS